MDGTQGGMRVEKLSETNFHAWKQKIQLVLSLREFVEFIEDDPPVQDDDNLRAWKKSYRRAMALIGLSLSDEHLDHVHGVATAKEMWQSIINGFERHTLLNKLAARRKFYAASMQDDEKILPYLNSICQLGSTLKSMCDDIDEKETAMTVLNGLPDQYGGLISALDALGNENKICTLDFGQNPSIAIVTTYWYAG